MKKLCLAFLVAVMVSGCATPQIPRYIQNRRPYQKRFYVNFDRTFSAVSGALDDLGWKIEETTDASVYEHSEFNQEEGHNRLIITAVRQTPLFLGTRYAEMNIYIRSRQEESEVELRYVTVNSVLFGSVTHYQNDGAARRLFKRIEEHILSQE